MLVGRDGEIDTLVKNLTTGTHTLVFGLVGTGKTALLHEVASRLTNHPDMAVAYVGDCRTRMSLLEGALQWVRPNTAWAAPPRRRLPVGERRMRIQDLRRELTGVARTRPVCLLLDNLPRLRRPMQRLLELLEQHCTLACAVTAERDGYDLYFWKYATLEIQDFARDIALRWIEIELASMPYPPAVRHGISREIVRLAGGNPGSIRATLEAIRRESEPLVDPIQIRRLYVDGQLKRLNSCIGSVLDSREVHEQRQDHVPLLCSRQRES